MTKTSGGQQVYVVKASGEPEPFASEKLEKSLRNAGASDEVITHILKDIREWITPGITTKKIYARAFSLLRQKKNPSALRYRLKQAILELGPTGYPFEQLIAQVFTQLGYATETGKVMKGRSLNHEMDVIATGAAVQHLIECKYSTNQGKQIGVQVPLYVRARVDDIVHRQLGLVRYQGFQFYAWVITNTKFSADSIQYAEWNGIHLIGWRYPKSQGLESMLEIHKIYPITVLPQLSKPTVQQLLQSGIVTCGQLAKQEKLLQQIVPNQRTYAQLIQSLEELCKQ